MIDQAAEPENGADGLSLGKRVIRFLPLAIVLAVLVLVLVSGVWKHLSLDDLKAQRGMLKAFVHDHPVESVLIYIAAYCVVVALSIPGALVMTLTGGFLFGALIGGAAAAAGVTSGAVIMFLVAHTALGDVIRKHAAPDGFMRKIDEGVRRHAFLYIFSLRLMPAMPIWLVNIGAAFVKTPLWIYALATLLGIAPSCFIYASVGATLDQVFAAGGTPTIHTLLQFKVLAPLVALCALAVLPLAYQVWRKGR